MRGDAPLLAEGVGKFSVAVAPEHVLQGHIDAGASSHGAVKNRVGVRDIQVDIHGIADAIAGSRYWRLAHRVVDEEFRVADLQFRVHDFAVGSGSPGEFFGAKRRLVKFDGARGIAANKIRGHGAISFRDGFYLIWHGNLLFGFSGRGSAALKREPGAITAIVRLRPRPCQYNRTSFSAGFTY